MTEPKILTPAEALRALADGEKLTHRDWDTKEFVELVGANFHDETGLPIDITPVTNFILYTEPKPKRKVAPYYVEYSNGSVILTDRCFETDEQARNDYVKNISVTRCMVLEREF